MIYVALSCVYIHNTYAIKYSCSGDINAIQSYFYYFSLYFSVFLLLSKEETKESVRRYAGPILLCCTSNPAAHWRFASMRRLANSFATTVPLTATNRIFIPTCL